MRFPMEVYRRVRKSVGDSYPVMIKLGSADAIEAGLTIEDSSRVARAMSEEGIDAIEISGGISGTKEMNIRTSINEEQDEAYFLDNARRFREVIDVPLMLVGGMRTPALMERLLEANETDMISLCRPFIREPDLVNRWKQGSRTKADCISCNGCEKYKDEPTRCIQLDKSD